MLTGARSSLREQPLSVLDLACGNGRNGKFLLTQGFSVQFADRNQAALTEIKHELEQPLYHQHKTRASFWNVDFEGKNFAELAHQQYAGIIVMRYLHRPLFEQIKQAIVPGGFIVYETFTLQQAEFGRPKNPDFLLALGELKRYFSGWEIKHSFEGITHSETSGQPQAIAQLIAIKPRG